MRLLSHPVLIRLAHEFSLRTWVVIVCLSFVVALSSGLVLAVSYGVPLPERLAEWYKQAELFARDTVRLTFRPRTAKQRMSESSETVFMAPPGLLDEKRNFVWLDNVAVANLQQPVVQAVGQESVREAKVPIRLLDPDWQPEFKGD